MEHEVTITASTQNESNCFMLGVVNKGIFFDCKVANKLYENCSVALRLIQTSMHNQLSCGLSPHFIERYIGG
jgi:hypothetical protein